MTTIKTDLSGGLTVPDCVIKRAMDNYGEADEDSLEEAIYELLEESKGAIVASKLAEFFCAFITGNIPEAGGYPIENEVEVYVDSKTLTVYAFGWNNGDKNEPLYLLVACEGN
jgi:hypothetical protein